MSKGHDADLKLLEKRVTELNRALGKLSDGEDLRELLTILKQPGWTTPAELRFALGITETLLTHVGVVGELKTVLCMGSKAVGTDSHEMM